jgi:hypothetical protein
MAEKANIFIDETNEDVIDVIKQTMSVSVDDTGTPIVSFATNRGKGSGAQSMPVADFSEYISALEDISSNGIQEVPDQDLSPAEMVRDTIRNVEGTIQFRVRSGKGAKPAKIPAAQFGEVVALLRTCVPLVQEAAASYSEASADADEYEEDEE